MANVFVVLLFLIFALKTSTFEVVRLANFLSSLYCKNIPCGPRDLIDSYFHIGRVYGYIVVSWIQSWHQLKP